MSDKPLTGGSTMSDDFDAPLPDEFWLDCLS
jgi:hypothetical protein